MKAKLYKLFHKFGFEVRTLKSLEAEQNNKFHNPFTQLKELHTSSTCTIFDVGAYDGRISKEFFKIFPKAVIHAFEPFPESYSKLKDFQSHQTSLVINQCAVSDSKGTKSLYVNSFAPTNSLYQPNQVNEYHDALMKTQSKIDVSVTTLDEYCLEQGIASIDILKMDIQGGELDALRGASKLLETKSIKYIYVEVEFVEMYKQQPLFIDIAVFLKNQGFSLYNLYHNVNDSTGQIMWADALFVLNNK